MDAPTDARAKGFEVRRVSRSGRALPAVRAVPEGMAIQCSPTWRNAEAVFAPDGLILRHGDASVSLGWDEDWSFVPFAVFRYRSATPYGIGVAHRGAARELWRAWAIPLRLVPLPGRRRRVAIDSRLPWFIRGSDEVGLLDGLRLLLRADQRAVARLGEPDRIAALVAAIRSWDAPSNRLRPRVQGGRVTEVRAAMARLGFVHEALRPMPGWGADEASVLDQVTAELLTDPEVREARIPQAEIDAVVHAHYLSVAPWPFDVLLED